MLCATGSPNRQIRRVAPLMSCVMVASLSSNDGRQGGTAAVCRRRADGWIRIPVRKRINPCLDSIIALLYCCIQAIADNYSPRGLAGKQPDCSMGMLAFLSVFFSALQRCALPDFSPEPQRSALPGAPSEPYRHALPGALLKEDEMQAALRINRCSMQCAVGYRTCNCFEYQSAPLLE